MEMNPIRHHGSVSPFFLTALLGLGLASCQEGTSPAAPESGPVITEPRHLPVPALARTVDPGLREARTVLMGCLNRVQLVLRERGPQIAQFRRDDWSAEIGGCEQASVLSSSICAYDWQVCPTGDGWNWEAYVFGCDLADLPSRRLTCRVRSAPYGAVGQVTSWPEEGKPGLDSDWVLSADGRTCDWRFWAKARDSSPLVVELRLIERGDGLTEAHAVCGDTVSWEGSLSAQGERGEMRILGRGRRGDPWILRHQIRWAGGHGEWLPEGRVW